MCIIEVKNSLFNICILVSKGCIFVGDMIVVYDKIKDSFKVYRDRLMVRVEYGLSPSDMLKATTTRYENSRYVIGIGEYIKSNRGGKR